MLWKKTYNALSAIFSLCMNDSICPMINKPTIKEVNMNILTVIMRSVNRYFIILLLMVIAAVSFSGSASAALYDLKSDWSDTYNPNALWSYNQGTTPLPSIPDFYPPEPGQPAWAWIQWPGHGHTPIWLRAVKDDSMGMDVMLGDVAVHGTDPANTLGTGEANVTWTSNLVGTAQIFGNVWFAGSLGRSVDWFLYHNSTLLTSGTVWDGDPYYRDNPVSFGTFSESLAVGDVITFQASASPGSLPHFVGVNLTIDDTPIPEPSALLLIGSGLAGIIGFGKNRLFKKA